jgi:hypothetical protein
MFYAYNERDDALAKALELIRYGRVPWEIEGDDGSVIHRCEIAKLVGELEPVLARRRKLY